MKRPRFDTSLFGASDPKEDVVMRMLEALRWLMSHVDACGRKLTLDEMCEIDDIMEKIDEFIESTK